MKRLIVMLAILIGIAGNAYPATVAPQLSDSIPKTWSYESDHITVLPSDDRWWEVFDDPALTSLIKRGEENSLNLRLAMRRIEMARQSWLAAKAGWFPQLGLTAGWTKERTSGDMTGMGRTATMSYFSLGLNFSWEIDVFGRVAAGVKEGKAAWQYSRAEYAATMISLGSNIAQAYVNLLLVRAEIGVAEKQIESQQKIHAITEARHEAGLASKLDVEQALTVLLSTQATLPALKASEASALNSLALLTGCYADSIRDETDVQRPLPNPFVMVNTGIPADLLRRRPDIIAAEYELAQYAAALGVAKKDFLPVLTLNGSVGTSAHRIDDLFTDRSFTYSIAPQLSWTIFEGLARNRRVAEAKEQMLAGIDNYNLAVMNAVTEADDAVASYRFALERIGLIAKVRDASAESFELALDRYKRGLTAFTDVMNAQISVLQYQNEYLQAKAAALSAVIKLYAAVAGSPITLK